MTSGQNPTLETIAREARVSRMTVSRALRNTRYVNQSTKERILKAAEKLGYRPNPMVSALMTYVRSRSNEKRVDVLAYLTSGPRRHDWRSISGHLRFYEGALQRADQRGYRLEEFWINEQNLGPNRLSQILYSRGICGVIIAPMATAHGHLNLDWPKFCSATIGYSLLKPFLSRASNDQFSSMLVALRRLYQLGYRRIGLAMPRFNDERVHYHWSAAYLSFHQRRHITRHPPLYLPLKWEKKGMLAWIRQHQVDAIVSTHPFAQRWIEEGGLRMPEDLGLVNLDWSSKLSCAGIDQKPDEIGAAALDLVVEQINSNEFGLPSTPRTVMLPGHWVDGPTVRST